MPTLIKPSYGVSESYRDCITAAGTVGATVAKADKALSTQILLEGKTPGDFAPALQSNQLKQKLVREAKKAAYPAGLDAAAPMKLLDDTGVTSFETDTTYKRVVGKINEWEVVIFLKCLQRGDCYHCSSLRSTHFFEKLYDEFQAVKLDVTGKPVAFKRFVEGGNIIAMNSDMEAAQVLGATRSFLKMNNAEYSKISNDTPAEEVAPEIIKLCTTHGKRAVLDFRGSIPDDDYSRLMDFVYIDSTEKLEEFSEFVRGLGVKKIQDWWDHKEMSTWILPCLVKSQSPMSAEDWDNTPATTNTGEAQHHWTNSRTGTKSSLVEAIESARKVDEGVAREIEIAIQSCVLVNPRNESFHRTARNSTRRATTMRKSRESRDIADGPGRTKSSRKGKSSRGRAAQTVVVSASSSRRVRTRTIESSPTPLRSTDNQVEAPPIASTSTAPPPIANWMVNWQYTPSVQPAQVNWQTPAVPSAAATTYNHNLGGYLPDSQLFGLEFPRVDSTPNFDDFGDIDWSFLNEFTAAPSAPTFNAAPQYFRDAGMEGMAMDYSFANTLGAQLASATPLSPPTPVPRLPPVPVLPPPAHDAEVCSAAPAASKKRKARQEVDPANIIHSTRARKVPKRADET
ncbi:hypothetical protein DFH09DRAFT_1373940 [Mycena vulgaris]|nr:hypothetical protein DFH09DRAFT_1373940 [Mycena vulgaris]